MNLNVVVLFDVSASMHGTSLSAMHDGYDIIRQLLPQVFGDWQQIYLSTLLYDSTVEIVCQKVNINSAPSLPPISASGLSNLGKAYQMLINWFQTDDNEYAQLIFLMSDGQATDDWISICDQLKPFLKRSIFIGIEPHEGGRINKLCHMSYIISITEIHTRLEEILKHEESLLQQMAQLESTETEED